VAEAVERFRELAARVGNVLRRPPAVTTAVVPREETGAGTQDQVLELALRLGLTEGDVAPCYSTSEAYEWCAALLGARSTPPPSPLPEALYGLLVKLVSTGRLDMGRARILGVDRLLERVFLGRVRRLSEVLESYALGRASKGVVVEEVSKTRELFQAVSRVSPPGAAEELIQKARSVAPALPEEVLVAALAGREPAVAVVEELTVRLRKIAAPEAEEARIPARAEKPRAEGVEASKVQEPRGE